MWSDVSELLAALILEDVFSDRCLWMHTAEALKRPRLPLRWRRRALSHSAMFRVWTTTTASVLGMRSSYIIRNCIGIDKFLINSRAAYTLNRENVPLLDNTTYNKLNVYIEPLICQNSISQNSLRQAYTNTDKCKHSNKTGAIIAQNDLWFIVSFQGEKQMYNQRDLIGGSHFLQRHCKNFQIWLHINAFSNGSILLVRLWFIWWSQVSEGH